MSIFDTILNTEITETNERRPPLPPGIYMGIFQTPKGREWKDPEDGHVVNFLDIPIKIQVEQELQNEGQPPEVTVQYSIVLSITPQGTLDNSVGKNNGQRQIREVLGLNEPGRAFRWSQVPGCPVKVQIAHREYQGESYEQVKRLLPI